MAQQYSTQQARADAAHRTRVRRGLLLDFQATRGKLDASHISAVRNISQDEWNLAANEDQEQTSEGNSDAA